MTLTVESILKNSYYSYLCYYFKRYRAFKLEKQISRKTHLSILFGRSLVGLYSFFSIVFPFSKQRDYEIKYQ